MIYYYVHVAWLLCMAWRIIGRCERGRLRSLPPRRAHRSPTLAVTAHAQLPHVRQLVVSEDVCRSVTVTSYESTTSYI